MLIQGGEPAKVVGTVNASEFLLALSVSVAFLLTLGFEAFGVATVGMIIGGVLAAPFGAMIVRRVRPEWLLRAVSIVLIATSAFAIWKAWPIF